MINVNIRYKGKELSTILPKCNDELRADLKKAGIDLPAEKLKLRSSAKEQYLVGLYTNNPLDDLIIDRLCNNDNLFELNNLCGILDNVADHDTTRLPAPGLTLLLQRSQVQLWTLRRYRL